ncbi:MAG: oligosaccharide flippase family protein [Ruminococcus flavefaciens]|nr:oligosaccharide flippase family protein [Ruminococcus flavefaciens]MCM1230528.1 oligosaccharide flippase family protein [Ruminococcus flavefaciens]
MNNTSREKNFAKSTFILAFGTFLPKFASFITLPIYTGYLTKEEYGTYDLITILCTLLLPIATLQIQSAVFRFLIDNRDKNEEKKAIITTLFAFVVPVSVVVLTVLFFVLYKLDILLRLLIVVYYFADILLVVTRQVARGMSKNHMYSVSAVINSFLNMGLVVLFLMGFKSGLNGLVASLTIATTVSFLYIFIALKTWRYIDVKTLNKQLFKEIISYAWPMVPNSISLWIMRLSDRLIISAVMGTAANAVYAVANKIPTLLQLAQNTFSMAWQESASLTVKDSDAEKYYSDMFKTLYRVMAGFTALLLGFQPIIFKILIKGEYEESYIHISILTMGLFFSNIATYLGGIYVANMRTKSIGVTTVIAAVLNFLINIVFINFIGIFAASLSTAISYFFLMMYRLIDIQKFQKIKYPLKEMVIVTLILIAMCVACTFRNMPVYIINLVVGSVIFGILNKNLAVSTVKAVKNKIIK